VDGLGESGHQGASELEGVRRTTPLLVARGMARWRGA
jgi:hypothetical protein